MAKVNHSLYLAIVRGIRETPVGNRLTILVRRIVSFHGEYPSRSS